MKTLRTLLIPCLLLFTTSAAMAQSQAKPQPVQHAAENHKIVAPQFFRLKFIVKELEGKKVIDSRIYTTEISALPLGARTSIAWERDRSIRADARVPFATNARTTGNAVVPSLGNAHVPYQYVEVGTEIDCTNPKLIGQKLAMHVAAHIFNSTIAKTFTSASRYVKGERVPIHQDNVWSSEVLVPIGQSTALFSSQEPTSTRTMELDVIATQIH